MENLTKMQVPVWSPRLVNLFNRSCLITNSLRAFSSSAYSNQSRGGLPRFYSDKLPPSKALSIFCTLYSLIAELVEVPFSQIWGSWLYWKKNRVECVQPTDYVKKIRTLLHFIWLLATDKLKLIFFLLHYLEVSWCYNYL